MYLQFFLAESIRGAGFNFELKNYNNDVIIAMMIRMIMIMKMIII